MLVGIVSTIFVGRLGKEELAAAGIVNNIIFFYQAVFAALSTGATVIVAREIGQRDMPKAKKVAEQSAIISIVLSVVFTAASFVFAVPILKLFLLGADLSVFDAVLSFYKITILGLPFMIISIVIGGAVRGAGDTRTPMYVSILVNIVNMLLGYVLIFGYGPIPPMGFFGAALAVTISRVLGGVAMLVVLYCGRTPVSLCRRPSFVYDVDIIRRIFNVGIPASLEQIVMQGGFLMMQILVISMGTVHSAVYQIGMSVNSLAFMPIFGFALAATTLVGQSLGKNEPDTAEAYALQTNYICVVLISIIGVFLFVFSRQLAALYSPDPQVIDLGSTVIKIFAVGEPLLAIMSVVSAVLRGAGDTKYIMYTSIVGIWIFRVFISFLLHKYFALGVIGVWIAIIADFVTRAAMYWVRFRSGKWKYIQV
jgi:putative MATE family efflux protein